MWGAAYYWTTMHSLGKLFMKLDLNLHTWIIFLTYKNLIKIKILLVILWNWRWKQNSMRLKKVLNPLYQGYILHVASNNAFHKYFFPLLPLLVGVKLILKFSWVIYLTPTQEAKKEREQKRNTMPIFEGHQQINWVRFYFFEAKYHGMKSFQDQNFHAQTFSWVKTNIV